MSRTPSRIPRRIPRRTSSPTSTPTTFRRRALVTLPAAALLALIPSSATAYPDPGQVTGDIVVHDPTMARTSSGKYLLYSTGDGLQLRTSTDRIAFGRNGSAFPTRPT